MDFEITYLLFDGLWMVDGSDNICTFFLHVLNIIGSILLFSFDVLSYRFKMAVIETFKNYVINNAKDNLA